MNDDYVEKQLEAFCAYLNTQAAKLGLDTTLRMSERWSNCVELMDSPHQFEGPEAVAFFVGLLEAGKCDE